MRPLSYLLMWLKMVWWMFQNEMMTTKLST